MWHSITHGNLLLNNLYSPVTATARPRSQLLEPGHLKQAALSQARLKDYDTYLLGIRKRKHIERVTKTKFLSKLLKKKNDDIPGGKTLLSGGSPSPGLSVDSARK